MLARLVFLFLGATAVGSAACGGSNAAGSGASPSDATAAVSLLVVARDERFEPAQLEAPAGPVSVRLDNQDDGVLHNIRFYKGESAEGQFVRKSEIRRGPKQDVLTVKLQAGTYFYDCEVHPASMTGTLVIR